MIAVDTRPEGARVTTDMIGSSTGERSVTWTERDTMLYAIGVGAGLGDPARELTFTTENSRGVTLQALPSFVTILAIGSLPPALVALDVGRFLHAEQGIEVLRPLPSSGSGFVETRVEAVFDKGSGAIVTNVATLRGGDDDPAPIAKVRTSIFVRGAGGFGGPRGTGVAHAFPDRAPDRRVIQATRPEQPLLYRLSGDRHPLHSDPTFAKERGFQGPIMHGLCTYGFACRALIEGAADGDPLLLRSMTGRFSKPVYGGGTLTTEIWLEDAGIALFRMTDGAGEQVMQNGLASVAALPDSDVRSQDGTATG